MRDYRQRVTDLIERRRTAGADGDDLLSILLTAERRDGYSLSDDEVRDDLLTPLLAGHETTSLALTYTTMLLAEHDDAAATLRDEVDAVLDGDRPGVEHVPRLQFTEQVIREAMRLYPPAFVFFRRATEDATIGG
jgi:cytochrome P450